MEWTAPNQYVNMGERNVHIWASRLGSNGHRCLVAGCWTDGNLTVGTFYEWLDHIAVQGQSPYALVAAGLNAGSMPIQAFIAHANACRSQIPQPRNSAAPLPQGHYFLFKLNVAGGLPMDPVVPLLNVPLFTSRTLTRGATGTNTPRNSRGSQLRTAVRLRDLRCRITGTQAPQRTRGMNFKGLQVAHIFPLGHMRKSTTLPHNVRTTLGNGNTPANAFLMRSDLHDQFDDYQFGFWWHQNGWRIYRFESSGAPGLGQPGNWGMFPSLGGTHTTPDPMPELFATHFVTCLLWHVRGFGREQGQ
ncbi:hypothetical protein B0H10DRAFT_1987715 [Mycena sp. CBHHK59/15]|nr:hypothetical protein B0H10DRAFT_1987715 [Mycena sp. CBHHK59/15]